MKGWLARVLAKQRARQAAMRHAAVVAQAIWTGSTAGYSFDRDLPRVESSTEVTLWRDAPARRSMSD